MSIDLNEKLILSIQKIGSKYPIEKIILFGSRARGSSRRSSDIDDLETLLKIDLVFINEKTDFKLMENIKKDGIVIYE